jgi:hypothetical protein
VMDRHDMWKDTMFILTTDHGYLLGEHGFMAKNYMPAYNEEFHIPLLVHLPGDIRAGDNINALTQNIDIMPTLMEYFNVPQGVCRNRLHGASWLPLLRGETGALRDCVLYGNFGKQVNLTDGRYTYFRAPGPANTPLNIYTAMPTCAPPVGYFDANCISDFSKVTAGPYLSWTDYPVYRIPAECVNGNSSPLTIKINEWEKDNMLFDIEADYAQECNLFFEHPELVRRLNGMMIEALKRHDSPPEQLERLELV